MKRKLPDWDKAQRKIFKKLTLAVEAGIELIDIERNKILDDIIYNQPQRWGYERTNALRNNVSKETDVKPKAIVGTLRENVEYAEPVEIKPYERGGRPHLNPALEASKDKLRKLFKNLRI